MVIEMFITCQTNDSEADGKEDIEFLQENSVFVYFFIIKPN